MEEGAQTWMEWPSVLEKKGREVIETVRVKKRVRGNRGTVALASWQDWGTHIGGRFDGGGGRTPGGEGRRKTRGGHRKQERNLRWARRPSKTSGPGLEKRGKNGEANVVRGKGRGGGGWGANPAINQEAAGNPVG